MPKPHLKIIGISLLFFAVAQASRPKNQQEDLAFAKRSLLEREREFFKTQPMSKDLRSFIEKWKTQSKREDKRQKRSQDIDENNLYVIQNGQLVSLQSIKEKKRIEKEEMKPENAGFTVVPLIIPINLKAPERKFVKARTLDEELENTEAKNDKSAAGSSVSSTPATLDEEEEGSDNNTKEETQVLHKILDDIQGLMQWKHEGNKKEGVICNVNGSWISEAAGMCFTIVYKNSTQKKFRIHLADRIPPNEDGFLCDGNWTVFGELPFYRSGMVIALAVHSKDKHIAMFIGECRVCEGSETVTGTWLIGRSSRDCKDQKASHKILSDVWRREQAHTLRKKHLEQIGYNVKDED